MNDTFRTVFLSCTPVAVVLLLPLFAPGANWNPLADTGLTQCHDADGAEISCPASGQDAQYQGALPSLQKNTDQTVTDTNTGLIWLQSAAGIQRTWQDAIAYCDELVFAGKSDWRLPTKFELESIVDYSRSYPAISQVFSCESSFYWSSTPHKPNPPYAWGVYCPDGADHWLHKTNRYYVRCVRDGE
jgi:hypothetical protein